MADNETGVSESERVEKKDDESERVEEKGSESERVDEKVTSQDTTSSATVSASAEDSVTMSQDKPRSPVSPVADDSSTHNKDSDKVSYARDLSLQEETHSASSDSDNKYGTLDEQLVIALSTINLTPTPFQTKCLAGSLYGDSLYLSTSESEARYFYMLVILNKLALGCQRAIFVTRTATAATGLRDQFLRIYAFMGKDGLKVVNTSGSKSDLKAADILIGTLDRIIELKGLDKIKTTDVTVLAVEGLEKLSPTIRDKVNALVEASDTKPQILFTASKGSKQLESFFYSCATAPELRYIFDEISEKQKEKSEERKRKRDERKIQKERATGDERVEAEVIDIPMEGIRRDRAVKAKGETRRRKLEEIESEDEEDVRIGGNERSERKKKNRKAIDHQPVSLLDKVEEKLDKESIERRQPRMVKDCLICGEKKMVSMQTPSCLNGGLGFRLREGNMPYYNTYEEAKDKFGLCASCRSATANVDDLVTKLKTAGIALVDALRRELLPRLQANAKDTHAKSIAHFVEDRIRNLPDVPFLVLDRVRLGAEPTTGPRLGGTPLVNYRPLPDIPLSTQGVTYYGMMEHIGRGMVSGVLDAGLQRGYKEGVDHVENEEVVRGFPCSVKGCDKVFDSINKRKLHLRNTHHLSKDGKRQIPVNLIGTEPAALPRLTGTPSLQPKKQFQPNSIVWRENAIPSVDRNTEEKVEDKTGSVAH